MTNENAAAKLGLIAGYGAFPLELAEILVAAGYELHVVAIREETGREIEKLATSTTWLHVGQLGGMLKAFTGAGVTEAIFAGKVRKLHLFRNFLPDMVAIRELMRLPDRRDDTIMLSIVDLLARNGITVLSQVAHAGAMLAGDGHLYGPKPGKEQWADIAFGMPQAKGIAALDIGQTVVVQEQAVLAVEAIEGTDEAIKRGGGLGNGKATVLKVAKPKQDLRFDVPAIGPDTLTTMHAAGCRTLAIEAGLTLMIERHRLAALAGELKISVVGVRVQS